jgi:hypothetical protein
VSADGNNNKCIVHEKNSGTFVEIIIASTLTQVPDSVVDSSFVNFLVYV